jgi:hypothetical protein
MGTPFILYSYAWGQRGLKTGYSRKIRHVDAAHLRSLIKVPGWPSPDKQK